jgi:general secretion pathway protein H
VAITRRAFKSHSQKAGFTLLELLVVMTVIALGTAGVALVMRDSGQTLVEREATRLASLLDVARSQSQTTGTLVVWEALQGANQPPSMRWSGLKSKEPLPSSWLDPSTQVTGNTRLILGPDPIIPVQSVQLTNGEHSRFITTDGVSLFSVQQPRQP